ncbi:MAG: Gfo/Idh/MocA family oxidoreductase [Opitutales bacterium]|nr:Gfo/Idh/MocA family oxidoreductase [Opitutales bacterium]
MPKTIRLAVIGCGGIAGNLHGPAYRRYMRLHGGLELVACCDTDASRAEIFRCRYGFARAFGDFRGVTLGKVTIGDDVHVAIGAQLIGESHGHEKLDETFWTQGMSFSLNHGSASADTPNLKHTEQWLATIYTLADLLGLAHHLGYRPQGIHRLEAANPLADNASRTIESRPPENH